MTSSRQRNRPGPGEGAARAEAVEKEAAEVESVETDTEAVEDGAVEAKVVEEEAPHKAASVKEPIALQGPFTVAGGNVLDAGGQKVAICGFDHNRANSGPAIADAVATALNRFYRTPPPPERDTP